VQNRTRLILGVGAYVGAIVAATACSIYYYRSNVGGTALWNANEAYFFIEVNREGVHDRYIRFPWVLFKEYVGAPEGADDSLAYLVVIHVMSSGVEHHVLMPEDRWNFFPRKLIPLEGNIYGGDCQGLPGCFSRWAGDHFEPAPQEEFRRLDDAYRRTDEEIEHGENGWSKREFGVESQDRTLAIQVGDQFGLSVKNLVTTGARRGSLSISLVRPGKPPERIWNFEVLPGWVSKREYQHAFSHPE
jgi:hypothetical protein